MKVLVCGATGCVGSAVASALHSRGHEVVAGSRAAADTRHSLHVDYRQPIEPAQWAERLRALRIDAVVNCVGILMPSRGQSFERVHTRGPVELFRGAALAGVRRVVQVSALGVGGNAASLVTPYLRSKLLADDSLASLPLEWAVLRPSLVYGPRSQSAALFATLASLPVIGLPGRGRQPVQPIHVYEVAEAVVRLLEQPGSLRAVHELGGAEALSYRRMLSCYRAAMGLPSALWLPLPMPLMRLAALAAEALPQKVFCRDTIALLDNGNVPEVNAAPHLLGRPPSTLAQGLAVTPPEPLIDLRVRISRPVSVVLRAALAFMWVYTALITLWMPEASGVLHLLARCGFEGQAAVAAMLFSCSLNLVLGLWGGWRPSPWTHALQCGAVLAYTSVAALNMPELTIDHCGPLVKNLPVLGLIIVLWLARTEAQALPRRTTDGRNQAAVPARSAWT